MFKPKTPVPLLCALTISLGLSASLGLAACGGSSAKPAQTPTVGSAATSAATATQVATTSQVPPSSIPPQAIIAHVGSKPIKFATVVHVLAIKSAQVPLPDPPSYTRCVASARAKGGKTVAGQSEAQLKELCRKDYEEQLQSAVSTAIHSQWLLGEAAELGLHVSAAEIQHEFAQSVKSFKSNAEFETYRKSTGESLTDMRLGLKLGKLTDKIFKKIKQKEHPATSAQVAAYYASHRAKFTIPEGRAIRILRTTTAASARKSKEEIQSGKSFAAAVKELSTVAQPLTAKDGQIADLTPTLFGEKVLNQAIFSAKPNRLYGPVRVIASHRDIAAESGSGYYLFEVIKSVPAKLTPLGPVRNSIAEELTKAQKEQTISSFVLAFRHKWSNRTDCEAGFVAINCKQYKAPKSVREDPFTL